MTRVRFERTATGEVLAATEEEAYAILLAAHPGDLTVLGRNAKGNGFHYSVTVAGSMDIESADLVSALRHIYSGQYIRILG